MSVATGGAQAEGGDNSDPSISADGRFVAFVSGATNLVPGDTNGVGDVFVRDRKTGKTERVSVATEGQQANDYSQHASISADGRFVTFASQANNLVPDDTEPCSSEGCDRDVFLRDRKTRTTERVSVSPGVGPSSPGGVNIGSVSSSISADGRFVAFASSTSDLVPGDTNRGGCDYDSLPHGRCGMDVFVRDRELGVTERVSVSSSGEQANDDSGFQGVALSADGRFVTFASGATNLVESDTNRSTDPDCFIRDPCGGFDVFVRDRELGVTERVSVSSSGKQANGGSGLPGVAISANGRFVGFDSHATNLVPSDTNDVRDVFVRRLHVQSGRP